MLRSESAEGASWIEPLTDEIDPLSLHDALPICRPPETAARAAGGAGLADAVGRRARRARRDRKSTRLNPSHSQITYAVFCVKKKSVRKHLVKRELAEH